MSIIPLVNHIHYLRLQCPFRFPVCKGVCFSAVAVVEHMYLIQHYFLYIFPQFYLVPIFIIFAMT